MLREGYPPGSRLFVLGREWLLDPMKNTLVWAITLEHCIFGVDGLEKLPELWAQIVNNWGEYLTD